VIVCVNVSISVCVSVNVHMLPHTPSPAGQEKEELIASFKKWIYLLESLH
jgi:hypothetical protein